MSAPLLDQAAADEPPGLWLSVSDIARARGVEKSSISRRVSRLEAVGFAEVRFGPGGKKLINLAAFDKATGEMTDEVRETNGSMRAGGQTPKRTGLAAEQARKTSYQAEMARLDLEERQGKLLPVENVRAAMVTIAEALVRSLERLPLRADDLAAAVAKDGAQGARAMLKAIVFEVRHQFAVDMRALAMTPEAPAVAGWHKTQEDFDAVEADTAARFAKLTER